MLCLLDFFFFSLSTSLPKSPMEPWYKPIRLSPSHAATAIIVWNLWLLFVSHWHLEELGSLETARGHGSVKDLNGRERKRREKPFNDRKQSFRNEINSQQNFGNFPTRNFWQSQEFNLDVLFLNSLCCCFQRKEQISLNLSIFHPKYLLCKADLGYISGKLYT